MKILVTGGFGYIGGRIVKHLLEKGHEIRICTSRQKEKYPIWSSKVEVMQASLSLDSDLEKLCNEVDVVIHLAAMNEIKSNRDPLGAVKVNCVNTLKLLLIAEKHKVTRFLYLSTAHVYKTPLVGLIDENTIVRPSNPYAFTHRAAEDYVLSFNDYNRVEGVVIRLSNGFGAPWDAGIDRWNLVVNNLCKQSVETGKLVLKSSGRQERNFVTLKDVARGVEHLMKLLKKDLGDAIYNLGGECSYSIYDMAAIIAGRCEIILGFRPPIEHPKPKEGENHDVLDFSVKKIKATGFKFQGKLEEEIDATLLLCNKAFG